MKCTSHLENSSDNFKLSFLDLDTIDTSELIIARFSIQMEKIKNLQYEFLELLSDLEAETLLKFNNY